MERLVTMKVEELHNHLKCALCTGYLVDATTVIECLHSFCRTCIVKYLKGSKFCPICDVQVDKTRPLKNIRSDTTLQAVVNKLVPGLYHDELRRRRDFSAAHPSAAEPDGVTSHAAAMTSQEAAVEDVVHRVMLKDAQQVSLVLQYHDRTGPQSAGSAGQPAAQGSVTSPARGPQDERFLLCAASTPVSVLKKFIRLKFDLHPPFEIEMFCSLEAGLRDDSTLADVAYVHAWTQMEPLRIAYFVYDRSYGDHRLPRRASTVAGIRRTANASWTPDIDLTEDSNAPKQPAAVAPLSEDSNGNTSDKENIAVVGTVVPVGDVTSEDKTVTSAADQSGAAVHAQKSAPTLAELLASDLNTNNQASPQKPPGDVITAAALTPSGKGAAPSRDQSPAHAQVKERHPALKSLLSRSPMPLQSLSACILLKPAPEQPQRPPVARATKPAVKKPRARKSPPTQPMSAKRPVTSQDGPAAVAQIPSNVQFETVFFNQDKDEIVLCPPALVTAPVTSLSHVVTGSTVDNPVQRTMTSSASAVTSSAPAVTSSTADRTLSAATISVAEAHAAAAAVKVTGLSEVKVNGLSEVKLNGLSEVKVNGLSADVRPTAHAPSHQMTAHAQLQQEPGTAQAQSCPPPAPAVLPATHIPSSDVTAQDKVEPKLDHKVEPTAPQQQPARPAPPVSDVTVPVPADVTALRASPAASVRSAPSPQVGVPPASPSNTARSLPSPRLPASPLQVTSQDRPAPGAAVCPERPLQEKVYAQPMTSEEGVAREDPLKSMQQLVNATMPVPPQKTAYGVIPPGPAGPAGPPNARLLKEQNLNLFASRLQQRAEQQLQAARPADLVRNPKHGPPPVPGYRLIAPKIPDESARYMSREQQAALARGRMNLAQRGGKRVHSMRDRIIALSALPAAHAQEGMMSSPPTAEEAPQKVDPHFGGRPEVTQIQQQQHGYPPNKRRKCFFNGAQAPPPYDPYNYDVHCDAVPERTPVSGYAGAAPLAHSKGVLSGPRPAPGPRMYPPRGSPHGPPLRHGSPLPAQSNNPLNLSRSGAPATPVNTPPAPPPPPNPLANGYDEPLDFTMKKR